MMRQTCCLIDFKSLIHEFIKFHAIYVGKKNLNIELSKKE
jgi:hypothetical protein